MKKLKNCTPRDHSGSTLGVMIRLLYCSRPAGSRPGFRFRLPYFQVCGRWAGNFTFGAGDGLMERAGSLALGGGMLGGFRPSRVQVCFVEFDDLQFRKFWRRLQRTTRIQSLTISNLPDKPKINYIVTRHVCMDINRFLYILGIFLRSVKIWYLAPCCIFPHCIPFPSQPFQFHS
jgi:hypothetical protein